MAFFVYILHSKSHDRYYIGQTNDLEKRLIRHNSGYVNSTKPYMPWSLEYSEEYNSRKEAMNREAKLKAMKSKLYLIELINTSR